MFFKVFLLSVLKTTRGFNSDKYVKPPVFKLSVPNLWIQSLGNFKVSWLNCNYSHHVIRFSRRKFFCEFVSVIFLYFKQLTWRFSTECFSVNLKVVSICLTWGMAQAIIKPSRFWGHREWVHKAGTFSFPAFLSSLTVQHLKF